MEKRCSYREKRILPFPKFQDSIFKGFGPAFLAIALAIGSGELILWPYLSAHYGFGIIWGAVLGILMQVIIIVALERQTAFLGENAIASFSRIFSYAFLWIFFSTLIGFGWPGFAAMVSKLILGYFKLPFSISTVSIFVLILAVGILTIGENSYQRILKFQKWNMSIFFVLILFLFLWAIVKSPENLLALLKGFFGIGENYLFIPAGISFSVLLGAIAYAGSGGNLLLMNSFYVEKEKKGLTQLRKVDDDFIIPSGEIESLERAKNFSQHSWKQNIVFFFLFGIILIVMLSLIARTSLSGKNLVDDFSFLFQEAHAFQEIIPIIGPIFIILSAMTLFAVQLGILDFIGRIVQYYGQSQPSLKEGGMKKIASYKKAIFTSGIFGILILLFGFTQPKNLIILGSVLNAFSMGITAYLAFRVEKQCIPHYLQSKFLKYSLPLISLFYTLFFLFVVYQKLFLSH